MLSQQFYSLLADITLILHFVFILFAVFGAFLVLRWRWLAWLHIPTFIWASTINVSSWYCPLTPLERYLRRAAGEPAYEGGFIDHYIGPVVYPHGLSSSTLVLISVALFVWNILIYIYILYVSCAANKK
jgi:hypothetical protein